MLSIVEKNPSEGWLPDILWAQSIRAVRQGKVLVITGAGISAESGIPTYRGTDGYWTKGSKNYAPEEIAKSSTLERSPDLLWEWYLNRLTGPMATASPNAGHYALRRLETACNDFMLVTQNIDGLHLQAGSSEERTIEIHGCARKMRCSAHCWLRHPDSPIFHDTPRNGKFPDDFSCSRCGTHMRPHVLLFDEAYSEELYRSRTAHAFAQEADLVITVGCAGIVPIAQILANYADVNEAIVIDINPEEGPLARLAQDRGVWLKGNAASVLPKLVDFLTL